MSADQIRAARRALMQAEAAVQLATIEHELAVERLILANQNHALAVERLRRAEGRDEPT
jgi:hypothetical protein